jgi:hypothetical protein
LKALCARHTRPELLAIRDGKVFDLARLLPPEFSSGKLTSFPALAAAFAEFRLLHSLFRPAHDLELHVLWARLCTWAEQGVGVESSLAYLHGFMAKHAAFSAPWDMYDQDLAQRFVLAALYGQGGSKRSVAAGGPGAAPVSGPPTPKTTRAKGPLSQDDRNKIFKKSIERQICGHYNVGTCVEAVGSGDTHAKATSGGSVQVRHACVACSGAHRFTECTDAPSKARVLA